MRPGLFSLFNRVGAWVLLLFLVTPALIAIPVSLTPKRFLSMPGGELSLRHFQKLFTSEEWLSSFFQSGVIAVSTSVLATTLGTLCAVGLWRAGEGISALAADHSTNHFGHGILPPLDTAGATGQLRRADPCAYHPRRSYGVDHSQRVACHIRSQAGTSVKEPWCLKLDNHAARDPAFDQTGCICGGIVRLYPELG
jgi:hypothetical protein